MVRKKAFDGVEPVIKAESSDVCERSSATVRAEGYGYVNVREKPSIEAKIVETVPCGFKVAAEPEKGGWRRVANGYIMAEYLE